MSDTSVGLVIHMETEGIARIGGIYSNVNHPTSESLQLYAEWLKG